MFKVSDFLFLAVAFPSFLFSVALWFPWFGQPDRDSGVFVGLWVPSILALGVVHRRRVQAVGQEWCDQKRGVSAVM